MPYMEWSDKFSTGVKEFDEHHRHLLDLFNGLYDAMKEGKGRDIIGGIFLQLADYVQYHFRAEELAMEKAGYSDLAAHRKEHRKLENELLDLQISFRKGELLIGIETLNFLKEWLFNHIFKTDMDYSLLLGEKGTKR